jgi:uncharacterized ferredoxin-like protein
MTRTKKFAGAETLFFSPAVYNRMTAEKDAVATVANLMALAARTAPKAKGVDTIFVKVLTKKEIKDLATRLKSLGEERDLHFFLRDAKNIAASDGCIIIGAQGNVPAGVNCGACGFSTCAEFTKNFIKKDKKTTDFTGPNCSVRMADLGIALGSAVKTAQVHNVDNRIMYTGGVAAMDLGTLGEDCTIAYAIPLSATGKNIYFDRK